MATKNQHYVPQFLLRNFSNSDNSENRIHLYDMHKGEVRRNQSIKNVCSGNYTYDKDNETENFLSEHIEAPAAVEIESIISPSRALPPIAREALLKFILVQMHRTRRAYRGNIDFINSMMKTVFGEMARLNNGDVSRATEFRITPSEPRVVLSYTSVYAATLYPLLSDLSLFLAINKTSEEFIISDHPVFQYNWHLRDSSHALSNSMTAHGVQFFMPISPEITLCLYDPAIYVYRSQSHSGISEISLADVKILNSLQALNADALLIARSEKMLPVIQALGDHYAEKQAFTFSSGWSPATPRDDGTIRSTHMAQRIQTKIPSLPSFIKVKNKVRRRPVECGHRNPGIVRQLEIRDEKLGLRKK